MSLFPSSQPAQSYRLKRTLLACAFYALCAMIAGFCAWHGLYPVFPLVAYAVGVVVVSAAFFTITRFGWNLRFKDPSLTQAQIASSVLLCSYILVYAGPFRGVFMFAFVIGIMFAGTQLTTWQLARLACVPIALFPVVVFMAARYSPATFDWRVEFVNWVSLCVILAFSVVLVGSLSYLHARLKASKAELESAMARMTDMAVHDDLTGLHNRRYLLDMLERAKSMTDRCTSGSFCVCLLDIDHFKRINDTYGHGDGDTVLRTFARVAERCVRSADFLGRWGGEEFLLLLPQSSLEVAASCVERIMEELEQTTFDGLPPELRITVSVGIAQYRATAAVNELIERADQALYSAKKAGRNRIVKAVPECEPTA